MPLTAVGKIFRPRLRQLITEKTISELLEKNGIAARVSTGPHKQKGLPEGVHLADPGSTGMAEELLQNFALPITIEAD